MDGTPLLPKHRRLGTALAMSSLLLVGACSTSATNTAGEDTGADAGVSITPEDSSAKVATDTPVMVQADNGTVTEVTVDQEPAGADSAGSSGQRDDGDKKLDALTGTFNDDKTEWVSDWTMTPGNAVTVTATAETPEGETAEVVSEFTTQQAPEGQRLELESNLPGSGDTVGVGMPLIVNFDQPVANRAEVAAAMEVQSEKAANGAWNWFRDSNGEYTKAVFRPEEYWEPHQQVTVDMHLAGVQASEDVRGIKNHRLEFEVGRSQITRTSNDTHRMIVERDGEQVKDFPVSLGDGSEPEYRTTSGTHVVKSRRQDYTMDSSTVNIPEDSSDSYELEVEYAMRLTNSGIFAHHSPDNTSLGETNVSHGCINMSLEDSRWFYENSLLGDPYEVTGTTRDLEVTNGWGYWQRSWDEWLENSAGGNADKTDEPGTPGSPFTEK